MAPRDMRPKKFANIPLTGWVGLAFVIMIMAVFLIALPALRWFFLLSIPPGLLIGGVLYLLHRRQD